MSSTITNGAGPVSTRKRLWWIVAGLALLLYLILALHQLDLPGLNYDETLDAVPAMQIVQNQRVDSFATLKIGGRSWPLMTMPYVGVTTTHILMPVFAVFGASVATVRGTAVLIGLISLVLSFAFLRDLFDRRVAAMSILLLAVNPSFVFWSRMGAWVQLVLFPITILALWFLFRWYRRRKSGYLVVAAFLLGLGLGSHIQFLWMWVALFVAWLVLSPWLGSGRGLLRWTWPLQRAKPGVWLLSLAALLLGTAPLLVYNARTHGTFEYALDSVVSQEMERVPGLQGTGEIALQTLRDTPAMALRTFETLLNGDWFGSKLGGPFHDPIAVTTFVIALLVILALVLLHKLSYRWRRIAFMLVLLVSITLQSVIVTSAESTHHLLIVWPIPQALVSVALFGLVDLVSPTSRVRRAIRLTVVGTAIVILAGAELITTYQYHRALARTGGVGLFSDAIYTLAADLEQPGAPQPISMDWGFRRNLQLLTQNRIDAQEWFTYTPPESSEYVGYVQDLIERNPNAVYLFHVPKYTAFPGHWEVFDDVAYRHHLSPVLWKTYAQRDDVPVYLAYTLQPTPRLFETPPVDHALDVQLGEQLALLGFDDAKAQITPGKDLKLTLYWMALARPDGNYKVFAHLIDDNGKLWSQHDDFPAFGSYPMVEWQGGEVVADRIKIELPADIPAGVYHVFVGMYDPATGERLPLVRDGERLQGDTIELASVTIG